MNTENTIKFADSILESIQYVVGLVWVLLHFYYIVFIPFSPDILCIIHLGGGALILTLMFIIKDLRNGNKLKAFNSGLVGVLAVAATCYFFFCYDDLAERIGQPATEDIVYGLMLIVGVLLLIVRVWGKIIPAIIVVSMLYGIFGHYFGGILYHGGIELDRLVGYSCTFFTGIYGSLTTLSATLIFHFLIFGSLLQACGGMEFIEKVSFIIGVRFRSGVAQTAIYSSAFMGMISGSTAANVAVTGAFTIPLMKKNGYAPEFAGAVEAAASSGGQIMPPIMGITAFLIASMLARPYVEIAIAALLPAIIYFGYLSICVAIETRKSGIQPKTRPEDMPPYTFLDIVKQYGAVALLPIVILTWRMVAGDSPTRAVLYADVALISFGFIKALWRDRASGLLRATADFWRTIFKNIFAGGMEGAKLAIICAGMGVIIEMFTTTGFGQRLSYSIVTIAGENVILLVMLVGLLTIFFGMGMPTPGAYLLAVLLSAPALIRLGFEPLSVHMFVFYFAILSGITPPVAIAVVVAAGISDGRYFATAKRALMLALPGFLMPFVFMYVPQVLTLNSDPFHALLLNFALFVGIIAVTVAIEGWFKAAVNIPFRILLFISACAIFIPETISTTIGSAAILLIFAINLMSKEKQHA